MKLEGPRDFENAMLDIYKRAKSEAGYTASEFLNMLFKHGGLGTAKQLINSPKESVGYENLSQRGRLDLSVEAVVVEHSNWHSLFAPEEVQKARNRLRAYEYTPKQRN